MTIVRIVLADPRTGRPPRGGGVNGQLLIVLADDTGHRAVPLWLPGLEFKLLWRLLDPPARDAVMDGVLAGRSSSNHSNLKSKPGSHSGTAR